jgi:hypothetical protein
MFQIKVAEKSKHILRSVISFSENLAVCEKWWSERGRRQYGAYAWHIG